MDNSWSTLYIIFNALLWSVLLLSYYYKKKKLGVGGYIILLYMIISILCIHLYNNPYALGMFEDIKIFPYIYLFFMINIVLLPIYYIDSKDILYIEPPTELLFNLVVAIIVLLSLYDIVDVLHNLKNGLFLLFVDESYGRDAYQSVVDSMQYNSDNSTNILNVISNVAKWISPPFLLYYIALDNKNKYLFIGLIVSSLIMPLSAISLGSRGSLAMFIFNMFFGYMFIRRFISNHIKKKVQYFSIFSCVLLLIPFLLVTISRSLGDLNRVAFSIERYLCEGFLRFNNYGLEPNGCRYGDYTLVVFKEVLGLDPAKGYIDRILKYPNLRMDESVFYTFVGDFTLDFGPIISVLIFIFISTFFYRLLKIKNRVMGFHQYLLFYLLLIGCIGYYQFPLGRIEGNLQLIALLLLSVVFKLDSMLKKIKK